MDYCEDKRPDFFLNGRLAFFGRVIFCLSFLGLWATAFLSTTMAFL